MRITKPFLLLFTVLQISVFAYSQQAGMLSRPGVNSVSPLLPYSKATEKLPDFNYPVSTCFTYSFKMRVGQPVGKTFIRQTFKAESGFVYLIGVMEDPTGIRSSFLQQVNLQGDIVWSKIYAQSSVSTNFEAIAQLPNGHLMITGYYEQSPVVSISFFTEMDEDGNVVWIRSFNYQNYKSRGIAVAPASGIGFAASDDSTLICGKLDWSGNLVWSRRLRVAEEGHVIGIVNDREGDGWYIGYAGKDSAMSVGFVIKANMATGNITWINRVGGKSTNTDFIFHDIELVNIRPRVVGVYAEKNQPFQLFKATFNGTGITEGLITMNVPGTTIDETAQSGISDWGEAIAFRPSSAENKIYALNFLDDSYDENPIWHKKFSIPADFNLVDIERAFDGGFYISNNIANTPADIQGYILKTDSTGTIRNCEGEVYPVTASVSFNKYVTRATNPSTIPNLVIFPTSIQVGVNPIPWTVECKDLSCPAPVIEDPCLTSFIKTYRGVNYCDMGTYLLIDGTNKLNVLGRTRNNPWDASTDMGTISRMDSKGVLEKRKQFAVGSRGTFERMIYLKDGNILVQGNSVYPSPYTGIDTGYATITKFTPDFDFIWNRSFPVSGPYSNLYDILEGEDGSIFFTFAIGNGWCKNSFLMKMDASGNLIWTKEYNPLNACGMGGEGSTTQDKDHIYLTHWSSGTQGMLLFKIAKSDGNLVWTKAYNVPNGDQVHITRDISFLGNHLILQGYVNLKTNNSHSVIMRLDTDGNVKQAKYILPGPAGSELHSMAITQSKEIVLVGSGFQNAFMRLDSNLAVLNSKKMYMPSVTVFNVKEAADGSIYSTGYANSTTPYLLSMSLKRYSSDGLIGSCFADTLVPDMGDQVILVSNMTTSASNFNITTQSLPYFEATYSLQQDGLLCSNIATCNKIELTGQTTICDAAEYTVTATRNPGCNTPIMFTWSGDKIKVISKTETSLTFKFLESGTSKIKGRIFTGCQWIEDSIEVQAGIQPSSPLDLGPDLELCPGNTIELKAQSGYTSYLWNDGSTSPVLQVTTPGQYHVTATDACAGQRSDTIIVSMAPPVFLSLGNDREKCNSDTLHLTAPTGFMNYIWGPAYNLSGSGEKVVIAPAIDTIYYVKAEKTPGCFGFDTIRIKVNTSPAINLGKDTSFCAGNTLTLDAGAGFTQYAWSNGSNNQLININIPGTYQVKATTGQGCHSFDTLVLLNVWPLPVVTLDKDPALCFGESRQLQAGAFASYLWQNGSTLPVFNANAAGKYYVTVKDSHGCIGSDTTVITTIHPNPGGFLGEDTAICSYGSLDLKPNASYKNYSWNTGQAGAVITITMPGAYWLTVKDDNDCTGKDTINVALKQCMEGFFAPSAFSPNNDGKNDIFRPFLFGNVASYKLTVYNRWGQIIFETTDQYKGWDGRFNGTLQDSNVFVWMCSYRLDGQQAQVEKGKVVLIR